MEKIIEQMKKTVCKIVKKNGEKGTGFFCRIPFPYKDYIIPALITNNHVLNENDIENGKSIEITFNDDKETKNILINNTIKKYTNKDLDITIIEIDMIKEGIYDFLDVNDDIANKIELSNSYKKSSLYVLHYPRGNKINVSYGLSNGVSNYNIHHFCSTEFGSSGAPILSLETFKVIGIHKTGPKKVNSQYNIGTFFRGVIDHFYNDYNNKMKNINIKNTIYNNYRVIKTKKSTNNIDKGINKEKENYKPLINAAKYMLNVPSIKEKNKSILTENTIKKKGISTKDLYENFNNLKLNTLTIKYKKKENKNTINLFGTSFVQNNKNNCNLIINQKEVKLTDILNTNKFNKNEMNEIEVKLKEIKKITNMSYMFFKCEDLISFPEISNWDTNYVTDMSYMFCYLPLTSLPNISNWNTSKVTNMRHMFSHSSLKSLPDISKWNTSKVTDMSYMFFKCQLLTQFPNILNWDIKGVFIKTKMFDGCFIKIPQNFQS